VSLGYAVRAQNVAGTTHDILHTGENAAFTSNGIDKIDGWLSNTGTGDWDIIHFNFGLHDISRSPDTSAPTRTSEVDYQNNLRTLVDRMRVHSPSATIIFATTTPIQAQSNRNPSDVPTYNALALGVMTEKDVLVNDLYSMMLPNLATYSSDGTHFTPDGNQFNAENVVAYINSVPEPSTMWFVFLGGVFIVKRRIRSC